MSRRRNDLSEPEEAISTIIGLAVVGLAVKSITDHAFFWQTIPYIAIPVFVLATILIFSWQHRKKRHQKLLKSFESGEFKDILNNFILSFGNAKPKNNWCIKGYCFEEYRLDDFYNQLREKGLKINKREFIQVIEDRVKTMNSEQMRESTEIKPSFLNSLDGTQFEILLMRLYTAMEYSVRKKGGVGDQGGDLIIYQNGQRILIQAKRYKDSVGNGAVQEAVAAKNHYNCLEAWVVTTGHFSSEAIALAKTNHVRLVGKNELQKDLREYLKENWA